MKRRRQNQTATAIRPLPAFQDLKKEIGYAAESGGTIHIALGNGSLVGERAVVSLAALQVIQELADTAVRYNAPPIITVGDATLLPIAQDIMRRAYERNGLISRYNPQRVRFIAPTFVSYAAGAATLFANETITANVMVGDFGQEVALIGAAGARHRVPQLAAAVAPEALGALYPLTERLAMGEELFAAGAQINPRRRYALSLIAEDWLRVILVALMLLGALLALLGIY